MKRLAMEELCGLILLLMVFLAAKYGSVQVVSAQAQKKEQPVVVVDVGHGGRDPGKVGIDGSLEKDVNLAIALRLKTYLEQSDVKVVMTRETDTALYGKEDSRKKMADMRERCRKAARIWWSASTRTAITRRRFPAARSFTISRRRRENGWQRSSSNGLTMYLGSRTAAWPGPTAIIIFCFM